MASKDWLERRELKLAKSELNKAAWAAARAAREEEVRETRAHKGAIRKAGTVLGPKKGALVKVNLDPRLMSEAELLVWAKALLTADKYDWAAWSRPEQRMPKGRWKIWLLMAGRGFGKMVPLSTNLPTPSGWTTMSELRVGDAVLDEQGRPCRVTWMSDIETPASAYELTFSDGAKQVACSDHQWITWTHRERKQHLRTGGGQEFPEQWAAKEPLTTQDIVDTLTFGKRGDTNHCVPVAGALDLPKTDLPIDPYVLGYWLGDGTARDGTFACEQADQPELLAALARAGIDAGGTPSDPQRIATRGLMVQLRALGVLSNKHVPAIYLRGSIEQRLDLLAGLMDSDGHCTAASGHVEFSAVDPALVLGVFELAVSLGQKPVIARGEAKLYGRVTGPKWRVTWRPTANCFRLERKAARVRPPGAQGLRNRHRMITSAVPVQPVPMRCITVDSPNAMYLVGRWMIPTHNTRCAAEAVREVCQTPGMRVAVIAKDHRALRDVCFEGKSGLISCIPPAEIKKYSKGLGDVGIEMVNGSIIKGYTAGEPDAVRGQAFDLIWGDEFAAWPKNRADDMLKQARLTLRESENARAILSTTPKRIPHVVAMVKAAEDPEEEIVITRGRSRDNTVLTEEWHRQMERDLGGTRLGRQELDGELVMDNERALWLGEMLEAARWDPPCKCSQKKLDEGLCECDPTPFPTNFVGVITGVDPSGSKDGDATGICTMAWDRDKTLYVLENMTTNGTPGERYTAVCLSAHRHLSSEIWYESAYGGDNAAFGIAQQWKNLVAGGQIPVGTPCPHIKASTIKGDKAARAMPVVDIYEMQMNRPERRRIWHAPPTAANGLAQLEEEMLTWETDAKKSPNAIDAMVHASRQILRRTGQEIGVASPVRRKQRRIRSGYDPFKK